MVRRAWSLDLVHQLLFILEMMMLAIFKSVIGMELTSVDVEIENVAEKRDLWILQLVV